MRDFYIVHENAWWLISFKVKGTWDWNLEILVDHNHDLTLTRTIDWSPLDSPRWY